MCYFILYVNIVKVFDIMYEEDEEQGDEEEKLDKVRICGGRRLDCSGSIRMRRSR